MVCAQLVVFGRVSMRREESKERARRRKDWSGRYKNGTVKEDAEMTNGVAQKAAADNTLLMSRLEATIARRAEIASKETEDAHFGGSDGSYMDSTDSETIL